MRIQQSGVNLLGGKKVICHLKSKLKNVEIGTKNWLIVGHLGFIYVYIYILMCERSM